MVLRPLEVRRRRPACRPHRRGSALVLLALLGGCQAAPPVPREPPDPTVLLHTDEAGELGVSTPFGVVFLGRGARSGEVEFRVPFSDGPSFENGIIETVGDGLYLTRAEIELPSVPLLFDPPAAGTAVRVRGLGPAPGRAPFDLPATVAIRPGVEGLLLADGGELAATGSDPVGAGVYVMERGEARLAGILTGRLVGAGEGGQDLWTVLGPDLLWRVATHDHGPERPRRMARRRDVLPG